ncbi:MAG: formate dehydrogenase accessory sulfurtransferase FdhD [Verrucomicrobiota bacterium]
MSLAKVLRAKPIARIEGAGPEARGDDLLAVEEPLEIRVAGRSVAVVMRTPGHDHELAAGFLVTEGILRNRDDVLDMVRCEAVRPIDPVDPAAHVTQGASRPNTAIVENTKENVENILDVLLAPGVEVDWSRLTRNVFTSSSCGICSKATIESVRAQFAAIAVPLAPRREVLVQLPDRLRAAQEGFAATGGLHASALFDAAGTLEVVREDVGRHNALDKVIGHAFFAEQLPLAGRILLVSGRVSFELMQKALAAGIPCVAAISAPTTAAVEFARETGQTLVGFLRGERMNVYAGTLSE